MKVTLRILLSIYLLIVPMFFFAQESKPIVEMKNHPVNIRKGPSATGEIALKASRGMQFDYLATEGQWYKIKLNDGSAGYVSKPLAEHITHYYTILEDKLKEEGATAWVFVHDDVTKKGKFQSSILTTYTIGKQGEKLVASYEQQYSDTNGSMRFVDSGNYSGTIDKNTIKLNKSVTLSDDGSISEEENLQTPIFIYYACEGSLFIDGVRYISTDSMEYSESF